MKGIISGLFIVLGVSVVVALREYWLLLVPDPSAYQGLGTKGRLSGRTEYFAPAVNRKRDDEINEECGGKGKLHFESGATLSFGQINNAHAEYTSACEQDQALPIGQDPTRSQDRVPTEGAQVVPSKYSPADLINMMRQRFPGREYYWVSRMYEPLKNSEIRKLRADGKKIPDGKAMKPHHFFIYCGFLDSLLEPTNAQCWRSVSCDSLSRLILAEDPDYVHDANSIPETRRRFKF